MTESDFNQLTDAVFARIERAIDDSGADIECNLNGAVMEIEFADGSQVIVNRHTPNQEMWLAAKSGGFHYAYDHGVWQSRRDSSEFFSQLAELIRLGASETVLF
jgi:CyaY protein